MLVAGGQLLLIELELIGRLQRVVAAGRIPPVCSSGRHHRQSPYMMLAAQARGLYSCWTGAFDEDEVKSALGLPQHIRPLVLLALGYGHPPSVLTERMAPEEHIHHDAW